MNVRELIKALADEEDMDSTVYVLVIDDVTGDKRYGDVDGIANYTFSYKPTKNRTCTTLTLGPIT